MPLLPVLVLAAVLQWYIVPGEGRTDQLALSLCRLWEECVRTVEVAEHDEDASSRLQPFCRDVADMLKERDAKNCEPLLFPDKDKQADNEGRPDPRGQSPPSDLASLVSDGRTNYLHDCAEIHTAAAMFGTVSSGVHDIKPDGLASPISVYCDQTTDGGGWTVIQRRFDGYIDFNRGYNAFKYGFGPANGEYWLGLENMYYLTNQNPYELYIELEDWSDVVKYARYDSFSVGGDPYHLHVSGFSGTAGDGFYVSDPSDAGYLNGQAFSARQVDNDSRDDISCAAGSGVPTGGWWYKGCSWSALNGPYLRPSDITSGSGFGIYWNPFGGWYRHYLKKSKMMVRPVDFQP
ncbi:PREDICTED: microfibril-associated glycoprotein 4-like [Branchiostoma belcheri]|uniref:Microfibril-associated glycoprotein 4-like n=1 Tax=Branchiostoma belcheri TaxID=7741 RepID=A0A6P4Z5M0_BRABE|nr:PREDICTED: microfibril-associated glycoprotein 4-like [Branchiostoma belcheri]